MNIWNPLAEKDWNALIAKYSEYDVPNARKFLSTYDWLGLFVRLGKLRNIKRDDLLAAILMLNNYDGVFNRESYSGFPSLGVFSKSADAFGIVNRYEWDYTSKLWRCVSQPNRVYDPKLKKLRILKETGIESGTEVDTNERQNFLEGYI